MEVTPRLAGGIGNEPVTTTTALARERWLAASSGVGARRRPWSWMTTSSGSWVVLPRPTSCTKPTRNPSTCFIASVTGLA